MDKWVSKLPWPLLKEMLLLMRVDKPIGTWLLLWPALWSITIVGEGVPDLKLFLIITVGAFVMRSAGCVANDIADREYDPFVERTKQRPLAAGRISLSWAVVLLIALLLVALFLASLLPALAIKLAVLGGFLAVTYPLTKRYFDFPQFYLGAAFGWGAVISWAAAAQEITGVTWLLFAATLTWTAGYDTIYAIVDRDDDLKIGVRSTAIRFGSQDLGWIMVLYAFSLFFLFLVGVYANQGAFFYLSLMIAQAHMGWQLYSIRNYDKKKLFNAFLSNRWVGLIILLGLALRIT
ncbi:4-hydroxybenzoate octaprenyltransferase [Magnetococcales bacterium HHB-1]